jgi:Flp pilus assembly protein TadD
MTPAATQDERRRLVLEPADELSARRYVEDAIARGDGDGAARWLGAIMALSPLTPDLAAPLRNLGQAYLAAGWLDRAALMLQRAASAQAVDWQGWNDLAVVQDRRGRPEEALRALKVAAVVAPEAATVLSNMADLLFRTDAHAEALRVASRVHADADASTTAGNSDLRLGRPRSAERHFHRAIALAPFSVPSLVGLGVARMTDEDVADAGRWWRRAQAIDPDKVDLNNNLATWSLVQGDYGRGFELYEWRWRRPEARSRRRGLPEWGGEPLNGRRILLYQEQGLGDVLQMARYVPVLARQGAEVVVECQPILHRLFRSLSGKPRLVVEGEAVDADVQAPFMSLPRILKTDLASIPGGGAYLSADDDLVASTAGLVSAVGRKIGLVWQGNPRQVDEPHRSVPLAALGPLLDLPRATFYGLQRDHGRDQMNDPRVRGRLIDLGLELDDLATTAAVLIHLDLVITTCTAMAHLAGALGRPVWILLKRGADWRWMLDRTDSPWYPTARLFRQRRPGDWQEVAKQVTEAARTWIG